MVIANKYVNFVGSETALSADVVGSSYIWDFKDGISATTYTGESSHIYTTEGTRVPQVKVNEVKYNLDRELISNKVAKIGFNGVPYFGNTLIFYDKSGGQYIDNTVSSIMFDFDDGTPPQSGSPTDTFSHAFPDANSLSVGLSAFDVSGNISTDSITILSFESSANRLRQEYISLCGSELHRFDPDRFINLTEFLPDNLKDSDIYDLVKVFEDFLNEMYDGILSYQIDTSAVDDTTTSVVYTLPYSSADLSNPKISILEKIKRISDSHDPDIIDPSYLQFFAKNLGYDININRNEFGSFDVYNQVCSAADQDRYLRFMISNLPNWYKIKSTNDMVKIMLYSFGLIGDIRNLYTKNYSESENDWTIDYDGNLNGIENTYYPTPHFVALIDLDLNASNLSTKLMEGEKIIKAIESIKPINSVFRGLSAISRQIAQLNVGCIARFSRYIKIESDWPSDYWALD